MTNWLSKAFRSKKKKKSSAARNHPIPAPGADMGIIVDVGLHLGEDAEYYAKRGYTVIGYEANPDLCEIAAKKLEGLDVEIKHKAKGGDLRIKYRDLEQLDALCRKLTSKR